MKLYATVTSERASKGQGGNQSLELAITAGEERENILTVFIGSNPEHKDKYTATIESVHGSGLWILYALRNKLNQEIERHLKGNKQKGEQCEEDGKPCVYLGTDGICQKCLRTK